MSSSWTFMWRNICDISARTLIRPFLPLIICDPKWDCRAGPFIWTSFRLRLFEVFIDASSVGRTGVESEFSFITSWIGRTHFAGTSGSANLTWPAASWSSMYAWKCFFTLGLDSNRFSIWMYLARDLWADSPKSIPTLKGIFTEYPPLGNLNVVLL